MSFHTSFKLGFILISFLVSTSLAQLIGEKPGPIRPGVIGEKPGPIRPGIVPTERRKYTDEVKEKSQVEFTSISDGQKHGYCKQLGKGDIRGGSDDWNGNDWNVALKANEYGITDIESCMTVACSPYADCVGVTWHDTPYCYVWDNCDFENLIERKEWVSLKKNQASTPKLKPTTPKISTVKPTAEKPAGSYSMHLAPPGSDSCDYGETVPKHECEAAGSLLSPNPGRTLQVGHGGKCLDGSWGQVPLGCSVQSGGDRAAHYKTSGDTGPGCIHTAYQLICRSNGKIGFLI